VIDLSTPEIETAETVAARVRRAYSYTTPERIVVSTDCGLKYRCPATPPRARSARCPPPRRCCAPSDHRSEIRIAAPWPDTVSRAAALTVCGILCAGAAGGAVAIMFVPLGFPAVLAVAIVTATTCVGIKRLYLRHLLREPHQSGP
jgi:hypothetical protein